MLITGLEFQILDFCAWAYENSSRRGDAMVVARGRELKEPSFEEPSSRTWDWGIELEEEAKEAMARGSSGSSVAKGLRCEHELGFQGTAELEMKGTSRQS